MIQSRPFSLMKELGHPSRTTPFVFQFILFNGLGLGWIDCWVGYACSRPSPPSQTQLLFNCLSLNQSQRGKRVVEWWTAELKTYNPLLAKQNEMKLEEPAALAPTQQSLSSTKENFHFSFCFVNSLVDWRNKKNWIDGCGWFVEWMGYRPEAHLRQWTPLQSTPLISAPSLLPSAILPRRRTQPITLLLLYWIMKGVCSSSL